MEYKSGFLITDEFDIRPEEISSMSVEGTWTNNGLGFHVEILTKQRKKLTYPNPPVKTEQEAKQIKQSIQNEVSKHHLHSLISK